MGKQNDAKPMLYIYKKEQTTNQIKQTTTTTTKNTQKYGHNNSKQTHWPLDISHHITSHYKLNNNKF